MNRELKDIWVEFWEVKRKGINLKGTDLEDFEAHAMCFQTFILQEQTLNRDEGVGQDYKNALPHLRRMKEIATKCIRITVEDSPVIVSSEEILDRLNQGQVQYTGMSVKGFEEPYLIFRNIDDDTVAFRCPKSAVSKELRDRLYGINLIAMNKF